MHKKSHELAGMKVKIKKESTHRQVPNFGGSEVFVEDWWDKLTGKSWMFSDGNPAALIYAMRSVDNDLPTDDEVVYVKLNGLGHIVHISELDN